ncbi:hypothetical protein SAMN05892883_0929 [Jatrophihabitans sp. GAS493]|uniref:hypothetical protein n=1 Tax=Jatrophihabitans sp. GAS493 TaxID=1907575 RepID=UPI000BB91D54|nr:hypothetical protein [Jatrophihabitans sp. GAS493]SOD71402.1 hypothetical protein SAMN05892883_0929 [Jatrophihabitans sp. GAS493]
MGEEFEGPYLRFAADAQTLAEIGRALLEQPRAIAVRLTPTLSDAAIAAWHRDESAALPSQETPAQSKLRNRAGVLAMIGLSIESVGYTVGEEMTVVLPEDLKAEAILAAASLLN